MSEPTTTVIPVDDERSVIVVDYGPDQPTMYHHARKTPTVNPVDEALDAEPGEWTLPDTLDALREYAGNDERLAALLLHPSWPNAPTALQEAVYDYLTPASTTAGDVAP